jgi:uncharacterized coiled-coil protein SlyX
MEALIAPAITLILAAAGYTAKVVSQLDRRIDNLEVDLAKNYVTREELDRKFDGLVISLRRMEEKLDAHVSEDQIMITRMKSKYFEL